MLSLTLLGWCQRKKKTCRNEGDVRGDWEGVRGQLREGHSLPLVAAGSGHTGCPRHGSCSTAHGQCAAVHDGAGAEARSGAAVAAAVAVATAAATDAKAAAAAAIGLPTANGTS